MQKCVFEERRKAKPIFIFIELIPVKLTSERDVDSLRLPGNDFIPLERHSTAALK